MDQVCAWLIWPDFIINLVVYFSFTVWSITPAGAGTGLRESCVLTAGEDGTVLVWDVGKTPGRLPSQPDSVYWRQPPPPQQAQLLSTATGIGSVAILPNSQLVWIVMGTSERGNLGLPSQSLSCAGGGIR